MQHPNGQKRNGQVQRDLVRVQAIADAALWFGSRGSATQGRGRAPRPRAVAVLEVTGTNFALLNVEEQLSLVEGYRGLLRGLSAGSSMQVLVRRQAADLSAYLALLTEREHDETVPPIYRQLARHHREHVQSILGQRVLFTSRFYLVLSHQEASLPRRMGGPRLFGRKPRETPSGDPSRGVVLAHLAARCKQVADQLGGVGLEVHRLADQELAELAADTLAPGSRTRLPLAPAVFQTREMPLFARAALASSSSPTVPPVLPVPLAQRVGAGEHPKHGGGRVSLPFRFPRRAAGRHAGPRRTRGTAQREETLPPLTSTLADLLAPGGVEEHPDFLFVDGGYVRSLVVTAFPREVHTGWLLPLLTHDDPLDVTVHLRGLDPAAILRKYRRRKAELQASKHLARKKGWVENPDDQVAETDVERLLRQVAERSELLLSVSLQIQIHAPSLPALDEATDRLRGVLGSLLVVAHPTTFEQIPAWQSMQPWNESRLAPRLVLDTATLADGFPFVANSLALPGGALAGISHTGDPVFLDYWSADLLDNPHCFLGAITGAGKSYDRKVNFLRQALIHPEEQILIIDPEGEYERICHALGGTFIRLAAGSDQHLNPFDLVPPGVSLDAYLADRSHGDRLAENVVWLGSLYNLMLSNWGAGGAIPLSPDEKGLLEHVTYEAYRKRGITSDAATHGQVPPTLTDVFQILEEGEVSHDDYGLTNRLYRFVSGSLAGIFAPTNVRLDGRLIVFDVRAMTGELRAIGIYLIANFLWGQVLADQSRPRALYIDEAWSLIQHPEGGAFLEDFARRARKRYLRLVTITQSPELFLADSHGAAIAGNAAIKILKKQDRTNVAAVGQRFGLTRPQQQQLTRLQKPESLLLAGGMHLLLTLETNPLEHRLATSDPRELAKLVAEEAPAESAATAADPDTEAESDAELAIAEKSVGAAPVPPTRPSRRAQTVPLPRLSPLALDEATARGTNGSGRNGHEQYPRGSERIAPGKG